jgi:transposase
MEVLHPICAGLDVHKKTVVACVRVSEGGKATHETRTFDTKTRGLIALFDWLQSKGCTHVVMESTGVYWKPVWHVFDGGFDEVVVANSTAVKTVPGRKSDVTDAQWLSDLLAHGLVRASFVPPEPIQDLRDLTRTRTQLVREASQHRQRLQKVLENCNLKIASVITDITGVSGRAILHRMIDGERRPEVLAELARGLVRKKIPDLIEALRGHIRPHDVFLMKQHLQMIETLEETIAAFEQRLEEALHPFAEAAALIETIPGIGPTGTRTLLAEIGSDMSRFPSAAHLRSWAGMCPGMNESAGRRRYAKLRKGAPWLKPVLVQCAKAAVKMRGTYLRAQYLRIMARRGKMKALVAVAASMLTAAYHILRDRVPYKDLGGDFFQQRDPSRSIARLTRAINNLGYAVALEPLAPAIAATV